MTADPPRDDADDLDEAEEALSWDTSIRDASYVEGPKPVARASTGAAAEAAEPASVAEPAEAVDPAKPPPARSCS